MEKIELAITKDTPLVEMNPGTGKIIIEGECYPENAFQFFKPIIDWVKSYVELNMGGLIAEIKLDYFNSSTSKCLLDFFEVLEDFHSRGGTVSVIWYYEDGDEDIRESVEDFSEDLSLAFRLKSYVVS